MNLNDDYQMFGRVNRQCDITSFKTIEARTTAEMDKKTIGRGHIFTVLVVLLYLLCS